MTPWTVACQSPLSMGFSRQEYWSGSPYPPPGDLPNPGIEPVSLMSPLQADSLLLNHQGSPQHSPNISQSLGNLISRTPCRHPETRWRRGGGDDQADGFKIQSRGLREADSASRGGWACPLRTARVTRRVSLGARGPSSLQ